MKDKKYTAADMTSATLWGCVVSETYLVHRCTTIFTKTSCVEAGLELNKPKDKTDVN